MQLPKDAQPRRGGDWMEPCHVFCVSKYHRQTSNEPLSLWVSPLHPARLPHPSALQPSFLSFLCTHFAAFLLVIYPCPSFLCPLIRLAGMFWCHHGTLLLRWGLSHCACGCAARVWSTEIKGCLIQIWADIISSKGKTPNLTNECRQVDLFGWRGWVLRDEHECVIISITVL